MNQPKSFKTEELQQQDFKTISTEQEKEEIIFPEELKPSVNEYWNEREQLDYNMALRNKPGSGWNEIIPIQFQGDATNIYWWTSSWMSLSLTATWIQTFTSSSTTASLFCWLPRKLNTAIYTTQLQWSAVDIIEFEADISYAAWDAWRIWFWWWSWADYYTATDVTAKALIQHLTTNAFVTINSADWVTQSLWNQAAIGNYTYFNKYRIVINIGIDIKLYINDNLASVKNTNLPVAWDVYFWMGTVVSWDIFSMQNAKIRIKYT